VKISQLTVEDGRAIKSLEGVLKSASLQGIKPTECEAVGHAVAWFSQLMKQYGAVWVAENEAKKEPEQPAPDAALKIKAFSPGKSK